MANNNNGKFREIEAVLVQHPGVLKAAVIAERLAAGGEKLAAYIVPDDEYLESALANSSEEASRVRKWRTVFDMMQQGKEADAAEPGFNIVSWNSSYTRQPIPAEQMRDWVECTVAEILSLKPRDVLEIGCGTGLLLLRVAPSCKRYVACDFSAASLKRLRSQMEQVAGSWEAVTLLERAADNFESLDDDSFDTVIINSVVQYFPNVSYLTKVLEGAVNAVRPGGSIFIGDVRSLPLLEVFAASVELFQAPAELSLKDLREQVRRRVNQQDELVLSPAFFLAFQQRSAKISRVEIRPKPGNSENEMTNFRYDVILQLGTARDVGEKIPWLNWVEQELTLAEIGKFLETQNLETLGISGVRNARIEKAFEALEKLSTAGSVGTAGELRESLAAAPARGIIPDALSTLGQRLKYETSFSWASARREGSYDVFFRRIADGQKSIAVSVAWPTPVTVSEDLARYANNPGRTALRRKLIPQLIDFTKQKLPETMVPATIVVADELP